jgi:hypothetical protein
MDFSCVYPTQEQLIKIRALLRCFFKSLAQPLFTEAFYDTISAAAGKCTKPRYHDLTNEGISTRAGVLSVSHSQRLHPAATGRALRNSEAPYPCLFFFHASLTEVLLTISSTFTAYVKHGLHSIWPTKS